MFTTKSQLEKEEGEMSQNNHKQVINHNLRSVYNRIRVCHKHSYAL